MLKRKYSLNTSRITLYQYNIFLCCFFTLMTQMPANFKTLLFTLSITFSLHNNKKKAKQLDKLTSNSINFAVLVMCRKSCAVSRQHCMHPKCTWKAGRPHTVTQTAGFIHRLVKLCRQPHRLQPVSYPFTGSLFTDDQIIASRTLWKAQGQFVEGQCWEMWILRQWKEEQTK